MAWESIQRRGQLTRLGGLALAAVVGLAGALGAAPAWGHGEKAQMAYLRMSTVYWYDVEWSKSSLGIGEQMELTGKFIANPHWPDSVAKPTTVFLNFGTPGPVFVRDGTWINGKFTPRSFGPIEYGKVYTFKNEVTARRAGTWHVHPYLNVAFGGPMIGPGKFVTIEGTTDEFLSFENWEETTTGKRINIERLGTSDVVTWHAIWVVIALGWIFYWFLFRGGIIGRAFRVKRLREEMGQSELELDGHMLSSRDTQIGIGMGVAVVLVVAVAYFYTEAQYETLIPLQAASHPTPEQPEGLKGLSDKVKATATSAKWDRPGRTMIVTMKVTNQTDSPIRLGEFTTANLRFRNPDVVAPEPDYPRYLMAPQGLTVDDPTPIASGETRTVTFKAQSAKWAIENMADMSYSANLEMGGLVMFFDDTGNREIGLINHGLVPVAGETTL